MSSTANRRNALGSGLRSVGMSLTLCACSSAALDSNSTAPDTAPVPGPPAAFELVALYDPPPNWSATALAFDPLRRGELWVTLRQFPSSKPCLENATSGCAALEGQVAWVQDATTVTPRMTLKKDGNAWHFMRRPTSLAFAENGNLATCGEARTDNYDNEAIDYSGPVLWSSDPAIFGVKPQPGQNGTHLDMLHETPFCMGIAYERENAYWVFNGKLGALDRYNFHAPHAVGGEDHADGELSRYVMGELLRVPEIPSHLALDRERGELYVADTGHGRIVRLAIESGTPGADVEALDPIAVHRQMDGAVLEELVPPGMLSAPSGLIFANDVVIAADNANSRIWWFKRDGAVLGSVDSQLPAGSLSGLSLGPDGNLYVSDLKRGLAYRMEAR